MKASGGVPSGLNLFEQDEYRAAAKSGDTRTMRTLRAVAQGRVGFGAPRKGNNIL